MATFCILHSKSTDGFCTRSSTNFEMQFEQHKNRHFPKGYKSGATDWTPFFVIDDIPIDTARRIEKHVKKVKSREYVERTIQK